MHFFVFIGANSAISLELKMLERGRDGVIVIAPAMKKSEVGLCKASIDKAFVALLETVQSAKVIDEKCRLSVCSFPTDSFEKLTYLWKNFGGASWINFVPFTNIHKPTKLRDDVESVLIENRLMLHKISGAVYSNRRKSPFCLPLKNFISDEANMLKAHWYWGLSGEELEEKIKLTMHKHRSRLCEDGVSFSDNRELVFSPAKDTECHGQVHPTGTNQKTYLRGKFRLGVSLYPGFHYDVKDGKGRNLQASLIDSDSGVRDLRSEKKSYINIFPNDVLLPKKQ